MAPRQIRQPDGSDLALRGISDIVGADGTKESLYLRFLADKSEESAKNYRSDLADLVAWLTGSSSRPCEIGDDVITSVLYELAKSPQEMFSEIAFAYQEHLVRIRLCAPNTVNRRMAALRSYLSLAREFGHSTLELRVRRISPERVRDVSGCGPEAYARMIKVARDKYEEAKSSFSGDELIAARDLALLTLYHDAGLRRFEPLGIVYPDDVDIPGSRIKFRGKSRKCKAWFPVNRRCIAAIRSLLVARGHDIGPLFYSTHPRHYGKPLVPRTANKIVERAAMAAGVSVSPHGLRHTAATTLLERTNGNVRAVAEFLRHTGLGIVQQYDDNRQNLPRQMGDVLDDPVKIIGDDIGSDSIA